MTEILIENLSCPTCNTTHHDKDEWAIKPHKTHLCLNCNQLFEGGIKAVSYPLFEEIKQPEDVVYVPITIIGMINHG